MVVSTSISTSVSTSVSGNVSPVDLISGGWEDDGVNDIAKQVIRWLGEQVKQVKVDELDVIDNDYLRGIESLYI